MRWRTIGFVSIGINIILILACVSVSRRNASRGGTVAYVVSDGSGGVKTNYVVRRLPFSWHELESTDYNIYIANLRDVGCPEQTIREIIISDVNTFFARRRALELVTSDQQWWRTTPDPQVVSAASQKAQALEDERRALLTKLLGITWESADMVGIPRPSRAGLVLDGAVLGPLPNETKQGIQDINLRSQARLQDYLDAQQRDGREPDPAVLAKLRQQTRDELARLLPPPQLEEFLLRYSQNANDLRGDFGELQYFNPSQEEFRQVFRATDALDQKIQSLEGADDPGSQSQLKALEDQRENAIKVALGPKRYEQYRQLHDPLYRDAVAEAQAAGTPDATARIYALKLAAQAGQNDIQSNPNLTDQQKTVESMRLELERAQANLLAAGQDLPPEPPTTPPLPAPRKVYVLGPGDSAATIAMMYGLPVQAILAANPKVNFKKLKVGQAITIPPSPLFPGSGP